MCDMVATSVMYIGLTLTYASSFQMLRGVFMLEILQILFVCKTFEDHGLLYYKFSCSDPVKVCGCG
jgi:hypothetical protein